MLGDEPARRRVGAAARAVVRRRGLRRGLAGAAGRGGVGHLARAGRSSWPATRDSCPHLVLHHRHRRRPGGRRCRRGAHRGRRVDPRRARRRPAEPSPGVALPLARRAAHRVRQRRGLRGVAGHLPRHRRRPGRAPRAGRGAGIIGEGETALESTPTEVERVVELVLEHARTQPGPHARRHRARHHPRDAGRGGPAPRAGRGARRRAGVLRRGPARAVLRQEPRAGAGRRARATSCSPSATARPRTAGCCTASARSTSRAASDGSTWRSPGRDGR